MEGIHDKAGSAYWTEVWEQAVLAPAVDVNARSLRRFPERVLHKIFKQAMSGRSTEGRKLLEIGCGNSGWLPYFKKEFGFEVYGIDYSEEGCRQAEMILERERVEGTIYCTDAFSPGEDLVAEFDVVCSFGVVEHFSDTVQTLDTFSKYLKKDGLLITTIPNMCGVNGWLHKKLNRGLYDIHVPIDREQLAAAAEACGLELLSCGYYVGVSLNVQLTGTGKPLRNYRLKRMISKAGAAVTLACWWLEEKTGAVPLTKWFSRGVYSIARKAR
jgi:2-polyprenyl-3-methyl-5-hydroxy-6-metoxy-1,4-benzoquinol methylase